MPQLKRAVASLHTAAPFLPSPGLKVTSSGPGRPGAHDPDDALQNKTRSEVGASATRFDGRKQRQESFILLVVQVNGDIVLTIIHVYDRDDGNRWSSISSSFQAALRDFAWRRGLRSLLQVIKRSGQSRSRFGGLVLNTLDRMNATITRQQIGALASLDVGLEPFAAQHRE